MSKNQRLESLNKQIEECGVTNAQHAEIITNPDQILQAVIAKVQTFDYLAYVESIGGNPDKYIKDGVAKIPQRIISVLISHYTHEVMNQEGYYLRQLFSSGVSGAIVYLYNGKFWQVVERVWIKELLQGMLMASGYDKLEAQTIYLVNLLLDTFYQMTPSQPSAESDRVLINLNNGTLEVLPTGETKLNQFRHGDMMTYCLPYDYKENSKGDIFMAYLNRVLPDRQSQAVLQELLGSIFVKSINLEKIGVLLGSGANGKSVLLKVITALLGDSNVSKMDLKALTTDRNADNNRSHLMGKLLNFAPEINAKGEQAHDLIKRMASGEDIQVKMLYKDTITIRDYAKLIFNANSLPTDNEISDGYFRRWLIIHFDQTIRDDEKDPELANKIISNDLPYVLNWIIEGAKRIAKNKAFSTCIKSDELLAEYQRDSDVVALWVDDCGYVSHDDNCVLLSDLYSKFKPWAFERGYFKIPVDKTVAKRLDHLGFLRRKGKPAGFYMILKSSNH